MAAILRKNLKISSLQKYKVLFTSLQHSDSHAFCRSACVPILTQRIRFYVTAVHKHKLNEDSTVSSQSFEASRVDTDLLSTIEESLTKIDFSVRRSGRILGKNVKSVFEMIKEAGVCSSTHGLYLLRSCSRMIDETPSKRIELADEIWRTLHELGSHLDVSHYNSILRIYVENNHEFSPADTLTSMEQKNIEPNKVTYFYLMVKYCNDGNLSGASEILEHMKEKALPVNEEIFASLMKCYLKMNDFPEAKNMLEVMRSSNLRPTAISYTALACGYAEKGDMEGIQSCLNEQKNGITISNNNYLQVIRVLALNGHQNYIDEVLDWMKNSSVYSHDFINEAVELIHKDLEDVAYKLILASSDPLNNAGTKVFIKQLIKNGKSAEEVISFCKDIFDKRLNPYIFNTAIRAAEEYEKFDDAIEFLGALQNLGFPVRCISFLPIFSHYKKKNCPEVIWSIMKKMYELGIPLDFTTYVDYVFPAVGVLHPRDMAAKIQGCGQVLSAAVDPLFEFYCSHEKMDYALYLVQNYNVQLKASFNFGQFLSQYQYFIGNSEYFEVLKYILENVGLFRQDTEAIRGKFLAELILTAPQLFDALLKYLGNKSLNVTPKSANICSRLLEEKNPALLVHLRRLLKPDSEYKKHMTFDEEEQLLMQLKKNDLPRRPYLKELLLYHIKEKNIDRIYQMQSILENEGFVFTPILCAHLINLFCAANDFESVEKYVSLLRKEFPTFELNTTTALKYAALLVKYKKYEEAIQVLKNKCKDPQFLSKKDALLRSLKRFLTAAAETGDVSFVRSIQDILLAVPKLHGSKNMILEPLIKAHLYRNDLHAAVDEYKTCVMNHFTSPCLNLLMKKGIISDNQVELQRVVDLATTSIGKNAALCELAAALVETGRNEQAKVVIQNLGNGINSAHLLDICSRFFNQNKVSELEQFIFITRGLENIDREKMYNNLLRLYVERNDYKKCLEISNALQLENIQPTAKTLALLSGILEKCNQPVPFAESAEKRQDSNTSSDLYKEKFLSYVNEEDYTSAVKELQRMKKGHIRSLHFEDVTHLIHLLVQNKCAASLSTNVPAMSYIIENANEIVRPLLQKYSEAGDVEALNEIASFLPDFILKKLYFNNFYCKACILSEKHEELLSELENRVDKKNKLFSILAFEELLKIPAFEERMVKLAEKYLEFKFEIPIAVVWAYYFSNENYSKAKEISKNHSIAIDKIDSVILRTVRQMENVAMGRKFIDFINSIHVRERTKERAYGTLLDVLVLRGLYDDAVELVKESEKFQVALHKHYGSTLITLRSALERENKRVPFDIPPENYESGLSSTS